MKLIHIHTRNFGDLVKETKTHTIIKLKNGKEFFAPTNEFINYDQYCSNNEINSFISYKNTFKALTKQEVISSIMKDYIREPQIRTLIMNKLEQIEYFNYEK